MRACRRRWATRRGACPATVATQQTRDSSSTTVVADEAHLVVGLRQVDVAAIDVLAVVPASRPHRRVVPPRRIGVRSSRAFELRIESVFQSPNNDCLPAGAEHPLLARSIVSHFQIHRLLIFVSILF